MSAITGLPAYEVDTLRRNPVHAVLRELVQSALESNVHATKDFKSLIGYLLDVADGRDRRESMGQRANSLRPVPKLRIAVEQAFGAYAEMPWFRLNKISNGSGKPLLGLYPRMAASIGRMKVADFGAVCAALVESNPDAAMMRLLQQRGGKIPGTGLGVFAPLASAFRPDLYFVMPEAWDRASGYSQYINRDLRKYLFVCAKLRQVCDRLGIEQAIRAGIVDLALRTPGPAKAALEAALNEALGGLMAHAVGPAAGDAFIASDEPRDFSSMPLEFAARMIRARRGDKTLRDSLLKRSGDTCAISGPCPRDLLEVAYFVPFPSGNVNAPDNAMLLRSDLHTLWDLNLIGIEPATGAIKLAKKLNKSVYAEYEGRNLHARLDGTKIASDALKQRWQIFMAGHAPAPPKPVAPAKQAHVAAAATAPIASQREDAARLTAREEAPRTSALADGPEKRTIIEPITRPGAEVNGTSIAH